MNLLFWVLRLVAAVIMLQTLYFKFSASEESVYIFTVLKMEPWGRIGVGVAELIASVLLLIPATTLYGSLLGMGLMMGAILSHLRDLGIEVKGDGGQLFLYALIVFLCCATLSYLQREQLTRLWRR
ncbi:MAG: DoxX family protein [Bacteroidetes bacterium]|nr:MAG: DoxX family protein [Bacteroidota bacterium]